MTGKVEKDVIHFTEDTSGACDEGMNVTDDKCNRGGRKGQRYIGILEHEGRDELNELVGGAAFRHQRIRRGYMME